MIKLTEVNYRVAEEVLNSKEMILKQASEIARMHEESCKLRSQQYVHDDKELLEFFKGEVTNAEAYLKDSSTVYYLKMLSEDDKQAQLDRMKADLELETEDQLWFNAITHAQAVFNTSFEEAEKQLVESYSNPDKLIKEIKYQIVNIWASHKHCQLLKGTVKVLRQRINDSATAYAEGTVSTTSKAKSKQLDNSQLVLMIMLLDEVYNINRSGAAASLIEFICALTGRDKSNIKTLVEKAGKNDFELLISEKKNYEDFKVIRPYFEKLDQEEVLEFIDKKIKKIKPLINK